MNRWKIPNTKGKYEIVERENNYDLYSNISNKFLKDCHGGFRHWSEREHFITFYDENGKAKKEVVKFSFLLSICFKQEGIKPIASNLSLF